MITEKLCSKCLQKKDISLFVKYTSKLKDGTIRHGHENVCKKCDNASRYARKTATPEKLAIYRDKSNARRRNNYYNNTERDHLKVSRYVSKLVKEGRFKDKWLRSRYGITMEDYNNMLAKQNNSCAICGISVQDYGKALVVDHCHGTGQVRGLLCNRCNMGDR